MWPGQALARYWHRKVPDSVPYGGRLMIALGLLVLMLIVAGLAAWFFTRPVATLTPASVSASAPVAALPPGVDATHVAAATDHEPAAALAAGAGEPAMLAASSPSLHPSSPQSAAGHAVRVRAETACMHQRPRRFCLIR